MQLKTMAFPRSPLCHFPQQHNNNDDDKNNKIIMNNNDTNSKLYIYNKHTVLMAIFGQLIRLLTA